MGVRTVRRLDVPHEDGEWVEMRMLSTTQQRELKSAGTQGKRLPGEDKDESVGWEYIDAVCQAVVVGWSYSENGEPIPVAPENVRDLDAKTAKWVFSEAMGMESDEEKKDA